MVAILILLTKFLMGPGVADMRPTISEHVVGVYADTLLDRRQEFLNNHLAEDSEEELDLAELQSLSIDLNNASAFDLARIPGISLAAIDSVVARRRIRRFVDLADLAELRIPDTDRMLLEAFTFVTSERVSRSVVRVQSTARFSRRIERARGYSGENPTYLGSPNRINNRTSASYGRHSAAITMDKPAGSRMDWSPAEGLYGFDRIHGHATFQVGQPARITIGDFRAEYGQGLTMWSGASFGRGREPVRGVMRSSRGVNGTASTMDDRMLRGIALSLHPFSRLRLDVFASSRRLDAAIDTFSVDEGQIVSARRMARTAHRTELEFGRRNALGERAIGSAITFKNGTTSLGLVAFKVYYSAAIAPGDRPDTYYFEGGAKLFHAGFHALTRFSHADIFGEVSLDGRRMVAGVRAGTGRDFEAVATVRHHSPRSDNPFAAGFASRSYPLANEQGGYVGVRMRVSESTTINAFADLAYHPWLRYQIPRPTVSADQFIEVRHRPRKWWELSVDFRRRTSESRLTSDSVSVVLLDRGSRQTLRIHSRIDATSRLRLQARAERAVSNRSTGTTASGYLLFHELTTPLTRFSDVTARITHFQVDHFDSRIYAYERDVIGAFTTHMHTGSGRRMYALLSARGPQRTVLQLRIARTWLDDVEYIGSGAGTIEGNTATDFSFLILHRLEGH
jgi:hypothetical protein